LSAGHACSLDAPCKAGLGDGDLFRRYPDRALFAAGRLFRSPGLAENSATR
jgi:hypothetical protein